MLIYILSRGARLYSTSRIYRAALKNRHNVRIIDHMECDLLVDGNDYKVIFNNEVLIRPDLVIPRIGSSATAYGTTVLSHFQEMGVPVLNNVNSILNSRDKFRCLQLLAAADIPIPVTYFSNDLHHAEKLVERKLGYPFIIKLLEGTQGEGVHLIKNELEAHEIFNRYGSSKKKILLQKFIAEFSGRDVRAFVVGDKVVAAMMRIAAQGDFRSNIHRGGRGEKIVLSEEEREMAIRAVKTLGLKVAGVDILRSKSGAMIIEVNSSPGLEGIETTTKIKIAEEIIHFIEENFR